MHDPIQINGVGRPGLQGREHSFVHTDQYVCIHVLYYFVIVIKYILNIKVNICSFRFYVVEIHE